LLWVLAFTSFPRKLPALAKSRLIYGKFKNYNFALSQVSELMKKLRNSMLRISEEGLDDKN
jgi:hypothetical protein